MKFAISEMSISNNHGHVCQLIKKSQDQLYAQYRKVHVYKIWSVSVMKFRGDLKKYHKISIEKLKKVNKFNTCMGQQFITKYISMVRLHHAGHFHTLSEFVYF